MIQPNLADYDETYRTFRWDVPAQFNFASDVVDSLAAEPGRLALLWEDRTGRTARFRFADFRDRSNRLANVLGGLGVGPGDRVLVMLPRVPEWQVSLLAAFKVQAIAIPCSEMLRPKDLAFRATHSGATTLITDGPGAEVAEQVRGACPVLRHFLLAGGSRPGWLDLARECERAPAAFTVAPTPSETPAIMYYTSGTAGEPKGVLHSQGALHAWRHQARYWLDLRETDLHWCTSGTGWAKAGTSILFGPWSWGTPVLMYDGPFEPPKQLALLAKYRITTNCFSPTEYRILVKEDLRGFDLSALRHSASAGEPLNAEVIRQWREATGVTIHDGYGLTEALMACHNYPGLPVKPGSMGKPLPGYRMAILDADGAEVAPGVEGDIAIYRPNPCLTLGLWNDPERSRALYRGDWYITGDRGLRDADSYFWYLGRADDVIISAGYRIGPFEVESALLQHPAVLESAVVASPDEVRGAIVKAFVVLRAGFAASQALAGELQDHVKAVAAPYKYPRDIEFVSDLPKTVTGKIRRAELRAREAARKKCDH
jgi:acetyl-CoA synthetase/medium-chain acyl-CoA synthetase